MDISKRVSLPVIVRQVHFEPETFNEEKRTVDMVFSTGAPVFRQELFSEPFIEELSLKKEHVRLDRLNNGAPLLNSHNARDINDVIGVVERAKVSAGTGKATVRFSKRESVAPIMEDVKDGVLRNSSVGYRVFKFEQRKDRDGMKVLRAIDWEPLEISIVGAGADPGAGFRTEENAHKNFCDIIDARTEDPDGQDNGTDPETPIPSKVEVKRVASVDTSSNDIKPTGDTQMDEKAKDQIRLDAAKVEKERAKGIKFAVRAAKLEDKFAEELIESDITLQDAQTRVINKLAEVDTETPTDPTNPKAVVSVTRDEADTRKEGMVEALLWKHRKARESTDHRGQVITMDGYPLTDKGRPFAYRSLLDMARMSLEGQGIDTRTLSKNEISTRAFHSTSDFPEILANVANKTMQQGYLRSPATWQPFTREVTAPDFKEISRLQLGDGEKLEKILEGGEYQRGTLSERAEKYNVEDFGKIIAMTRKMLINDDLSAFTRVPEKLGRRARDLESDSIWDEIEANPNLSDGNPVFDNAHGNLSGTPAIPTEDGLSEARKSMREQVGLDGEVIALSPKWIYVAPENETAAEKLIASIVPDSSTNVSPFSFKGRTPLQLAVEPRIQPSTGVTPWYVCASLSQVDMVELARLEGQEGPSIESRVGFDVDGLEVRIRHTIGVKIVEHRGLFKNAGV